MRQIRAALICAVAAISLLVSPGTAQAGIEDASDGAGFGVRVGFSGDGAPSGGGSTVVRMPASCWWTPINYMGFQQDNPSSWVEWYDTVVRELRDHAHAAIAYFQMGPRSMYEAAAASPNANALDLYGIDCRDDATYCSGILMSYAGTPQVYDPGGCPVPVTHRFFAGATPQPLVDPEDLAQVARDYMAIPDPVAERNPKLDIAGGSTLVSLPTWFWVTHPDAVGAATGGTPPMRAPLGPVTARAAAPTRRPHIC